MTGRGEGDAVTGSEEGAHGLGLAGGSMAAGDGTASNPGGSVSPGTGL